MRRSGKLEAIGLTGAAAGAATPRVADSAGSPRLATTAALLTLQGADVRFGDLRALHGIALQVAPGERIAIVGANGSGKTTLLRLLNGLLAPSAGQRLAPAVAGRPLRAAMLFQRPFLLHFSVRRNVQLALWLAGVPAAERAERTAVALARVGLQALAGRPGRALSGGQQQRLALARAWAQQPDVLFLDEPTASLDPSAKREVETLIEAFADAGTTLVMTSHNLGQVKRLASRVIYLEHGQLVADLPVHDFFNGPLPEAARLFVKGELV